MKAAPEEAEGHESGLLVNIVGTDGSGKTTQIELLGPWLATLGRSSRVLTKSSVFDPSRFPEALRLAGTYDELVDTGFPGMPAESRALFQFFLLMTAVRRYPPKSGEIVFIDGYWPKTYATEAALGADRAWLHGIGRGFPEPDICVVLDLAPELAAKRIPVIKGYETGFAAAPTEAAFTKHQERVRAELQRLALACQWPVIDASQPVNVVQSEIRRVLRSQLAGRRQQSLRSPNARSIESGSAAKPGAPSSIADELAAAGLSVPAEWLAGVAAGWSEMRASKRLLRRSRGSEVEPATLFKPRDGKV